MEENNLISISNRNVDLSQHTVKFYVDSLDRYNYIDQRNSGNYYSDSNYLEATLIKLKKQLDNHNFELPELIQLLIRVLNIGLNNRNTNNNVQLAFDILYNFPQENLLEAIFESSSKGPERKVSTMKLLTRNLRKQGDFTCQSSMLTLLVKLRNICQELDLSGVWFQNEGLKNSFQRICIEPIICPLRVRMFLNVFNKLHGPKATVVSFAAKSIYFGSYKLDYLPRELCNWVDFNKKFDNISVICPSIESNSDQQPQKVTLVPHDFDNCSLHEEESQLSDKTFYVFRMQSRHALTNYVPGLHNQSGNEVVITFRRHRYLPEAISVYFPQAIIPEQASSEPHAREFVRFRFFTTLFHADDRHLCLCRVIKKQTGFRYEVPEINVSVNTTQGSQDFQMSFEVPESTPDLASASHDHSTVITQHSTEGESNPSRSGRRDRCHSPNPEDNTSRDLPLTREISSFRRFKKCSVSSAEVISTSPKQKARQVRRPSFKKCSVPIEDVSPFQDSANDCSTRAITGTLEGYVRSLSQSEEWANSTLSQVPRKSENPQTLSQRSRIRHVVREPRRKKMSIAKTDVIFNPPFPYYHQSKRMKATHWDEGAEVSDKSLVRRTPSPRATSPTLDSDKASTVYGEESETSYHPPVDERPSRTLKKRRAHSVSAQQPVAQRLTRTSKKGRPQSASAQLPEDQRLTRTSKKGRPQSASAQLPGDQCLTRTSKKGRLQSGSAQLPEDQRLTRTSKKGRPQSASAQLPEDQRLTRTSKKRRSQSVSAQIPEDQRLTRTSKKGRPQSASAQLPVDERVCLTPKKLSQSDSTQMGNKIAPSAPVSEKIRLLSKEIKDKNEGWSTKKKKAPKGRHFRRIIQAPSDSQDTHQGSSVEDLKKSDNEPIVSQPSLANSQRESYETRKERHITPVSRSQGSDKEPVVSQQSLATSQRELFSNSKEPVSLESTLKLKLSSGTLDSKKQWQSQRDASELLKANFENSLVPESQVSDMSIFSHNSADPAIFNPTTVKSPENAPRSPARNALRDPSTDYVNGEPLSVHLTNAIAHHGPRDDAFDRSMEKSLEDSIDNARNDHETKIGEGTGHFDDSVEAPQQNNDECDQTEVSTERKLRESMGTQSEERSHELELLGKTNKERRDSQNVSLVEPNNQESSKLDENQSTLEMPTVEQNISCQNDEMDFSVVVSQKSPASIPESIEPSPEKAKAPNEKENVCPKRRVKNPISYIVPNITKHAIPFGLYVSPPETKPIEKTRAKPSPVKPKDNETRVTAKPTSVKSSKPTKKTMANLRESKGIRYIDPYDELAIAGTSRNVLAKTDKRKVKTRLTEKIDDDEISLFLSRPQTKSFTKKSSTRNATRNKNKQNQSLSVSKISETEESNSPSYLPVNKPCADKFDCLLRESDMPNRKFFKSFTPGQRHRDYSVTKKIQFGVEVVDFKAAQKKRNREIAKNRPRPKKKVPGDPYNLPSDSEKDDEIALVSLQSLRSATKSGRQNIEKRKTNKTFLETDKSLNWDELPTARVYKANVVNEPIPTKTPVGRRFNKRKTNLFFNDDTKSEEEHSIRKGFSKKPAVQIFSPSKFSDNFEHEIRTPPGYRVEDDSLEQIVIVGEGQDVSFEDLSDDEAPIPTSNGSDHRKLIGGNDPRSAKPTGRSQTNSQPVSNPVADSQLDTSDLNETPTKYSLKEMQRRLEEFWRKMAKLAHGRLEKIAAAQNQLAEQVLHEAGEESQIIVENCKLQKATRKTKRQRRQIFKNGLDSIEVAFSKEFSSSLDEALVIINQEYQRAVKGLKKKLLSEMTR